MKEFKIGKKYLFQGNEVEALGRGWDEDGVFVRKASGYIIHIEDADLQPIPPKQEFKEGQEVWVKCKIVERNISKMYPYHVEIGSDNYRTSLHKSVEIKPCDEQEVEIGSDNYRTSLHKSVEIKPCDEQENAENELLRVGDMVMIYEKRRLCWIYGINTDGTFSIIWEDGSIIYSLDKKFIKKIK